MRNHTISSTPSFNSLLNNQFKTEIKSTTCSQKMSIAARIIRSEFYYLDETSIISALNDISIFGKCPSNYSIEDLVSQWYSNCNFDFTA